MRIIVAGAKGLLGHEVAHVLRTSGYALIAADLEEDLPHDIAALDITQPEMVQGFLEATRPAWLINCAAYTQVDACEEHVDLAFQVNGKAPGYLAEACSEKGASLLHVSS
ncbi:MAG: sugar nucleotide-binding protein, partial [Deltaproteobacteria bacterium]|nr:sugar nucleotide-binding protein [Deltaproteobacteria bacterium]